MHLRFFAAATAVAAFAVPALAQEDDSKVYPLPLAFTEGDSVNTTVLNSPYIRWQQIVGHSFGAGREHLIQYISFRRDGLAAATQAGPRSVDIEIALGAVIRPSFTNSFASNWIPTSKVTVLARKTIMLPDWSATPVNAPAPFDLHIPLDFIYNHTAFVWLLAELQVWSSTAGDHPIDAATANGTSSSQSTSLGTGCITSTSGPAGFTSLCSVDVSGFGSSYALTLAASGAPPSTGVSFWIAATGAPIPLPGLCQPLQLAPALILGPLPSSASGMVSQAFPLGAYPQTFPGQPLYLQALALDATQTTGLPIAVSQGQQLLMPHEPFDMLYTSATTESATTGSGPFQSGLVILLSDTPPVQPTP